MAGGSCLLPPPSCFQNVSPVDIPESNLVNQQHPKEDDLVFLTVSEKRSPSFEEKENGGIHYVGLVTQFKPGNPTSKFRKYTVTCWAGRPS